MTTAVSHNLTKKQTHLTENQTLPAIWYQGKIVKSS